MDEPFFPMPLHELRAASTERLFEPLGRELDAIKAEMRKTWRGRLIVWASTKRPLVWLAARLNGARG